MLKNEKEEIDASCINNGKCYKKHRDYNISIGI